MPNYKNPDDGPRPIESLNPYDKGTTPTVEHHSRPWTEGVDLVNLCAADGQPAGYGSADVGSYDDDENDADMVAQFAGKPL